MAAIQTSLHGSCTLNTAVVLCGDRTVPAAEIVGNLRQLREHFPDQARTAAKVVVEDELLRTDAMGKKAVALAKEVLDDSTFRIRALADLERAAQRFRKGSVARITFREDGFPGVIVMSRLIEERRLSSKQGLLLQVIASRREWGTLHKRTVEVRSSQKVDPALLRLQWKSFESIVFI